MKKYGLLVLCLGVALFGILWINNKTNEAEMAAMEEATEIGWMDLQPKTVEEFDDPFVKLTDEQLLSLSLVARYREILQVQEKLSEVGQEELDTETAKLAEWGIDVDHYLNMRQEIMEQRIKQGFAVNPDLDGTQVRIPGFLLPLEFENDEVTEFLLVPYRGACIHTPPPPPNQIVHVKLESGYKFADMFEPIWAEGLISTETTNSSLAVVDGVIDVPTSYLLEAGVVEPYEY